MALKALLTTLFIVVEIIVFFGMVIWMDYLMKKYEVEFTELWLIFSVMIATVLFIWNTTSFILYMFF